LNQPNDLSKSRFFTFHGGTLAVADQSPDDPYQEERLADGIVDQKYKILALLGKGGMGAVYRTRHLMLEKDVALKTFRSATLTEEARLRFQREAQAIAKLSHINVVQVFDFGLFEDGVPYYTMEFLLGEPLADKIKKQGPMSIDQTVELFVQTCHGLSAAHNKGIVHRDLKPANLFIESTLSPRGKLDTIKIVDFGIASLTDQSIEGQKLTTLGAIFGSPLYMSPEHSIGQQVTHQSDIYSLGCTLFEALTGKPPFHGATALDTIMMHHNEDIPSLKQALSERDYPPALERMVAKMLAKTPQARQSNIDQVAEELSQVRKGQTIFSGQSVPQNHHAGERSAQSPTDPNATDLSETDPSLQSDATVPERKPSLALALTLTAALLAAGAGGFFYFNNRTQFKRTTQSSVSMVSQATDTKQEGDPFSPYKEAALFADTTDGVSSKTSLMSDQTTSPSITDGVPPQVERPTSTIKSGPDGRKYLVLKFPGDASFGIFKDPTFVDGKLEAKDTVTWPISTKPKFEPSIRFLQHPENLEIFGPDSLFGLNLIACPREQKESGVLHQINRLTGLKELNFSESDIVNGDITDLNKLINLQFLFLDNTNMNGKTLAKLSRLRQLNYLRYCRSQGVSELLAALKGSKCITDLYLTGDYLTASDFKLIATLTELKMLQLKQTRMTDADLQALTALTKLKYLACDKTKLTALALEPLKTMRSNGLEQVDMRGLNLSEADARKIRAIIPQARVTDDEYTDLEFMPTSAWKETEQ
jgi:serine/threonine protein kinase